MVLLLMVAGAAAGGACRPADPASVPPDASPAQAGALDLVRLRAEPHSLTYDSGFPREETLVVADPATWRDVWERIWSTHSPRPPLPPVDFGRDVILVAALGERPSGGHVILVDSAYRRDDHVEVVILIRSPGRDCLTTRAITHPVDAAIMPRTTLPVRFRQRSIVADCS